MHSYARVCMNMYVCICMYAYVCMHACVDTLLRTGMCAYVCIMHMYACMCRHTPVDRYVFACTHVCMYVCMYVCMCRYTPAVLVFRVCIYACMCVCMCRHRHTDLSVLYFRLCALLPIHLHTHTFTHIFSHTYIHIHMHSLAADARIMCLNMIIRRGDIRVCTHALPCSRC